MTELQSLKKSAIPMDLLRDDCKVIERRGGSPSDVKKAFARLHRVLAKMQPGKIDTVAEVRRVRNSPRTK